ncbi:unnamed protein product [Chrysodeixis includens]|uniref:Uncharacterized protein n=1 Tax=Chrysodeixis includens TaxID=689277 RepID=A0A9N8KYM6_CHRIL|nr:unnamed protein product [Chrysodeixis includens]
MFPTAPNIQEDFPGKKNQPSDAVALKLIPGDSTVVKKDGATHTISRYYVVPKEYDVNKTNGSDVTNAVTSNSRFGNSMGVGKNFTTVDKNSTSVNVTAVYLKEISEEKNPLNSKRLNPDGSYAIPDIDIRAKPMTNDLVSFSHQLGQGQASGNQVLETDGRMDQNLQSDLQRRERNRENVKLWIKMPPSSYSGKNSKTIKIQKRFVVNPASRIQAGKPVLGSLGYKVNLVPKESQSQIGRESEIYNDMNLNLDIIDTAEANKNPYFEQGANNLDLPLVTEGNNVIQATKIVSVMDGNQNTNGNPQVVNFDAGQNTNPQITFQGRYGFKSKDPHPPINLDDREYFNPDNIIIEDRYRGNEANPNRDFTIEDRIKDFTIEDRQNFPSIIEERQKGDLPWVTEDKQKANLPWIIEDRQKDNLPWIIEDRLKENLPWIIEDRQKGNLPWIIEDRQKENLPWIIEDRKKGNLPWIIEDRQKGNLPWIIEDRHKGNLPWIIGDRQKGKLPWIIEDRQKVNLPWDIEDRHKIEVPWVIEDRQQQDIPWVIEDRKHIKYSPLMYKKQVQGTSGHQISSLGKSQVYHTYIINPTKIMYKDADMQNELLNTLGEYEQNFSPTERNPSASNLMLSMQRPSGSYYKSQVSYSNGGGAQNPSVLVNQPGYFGSHIEAQEDEPDYVGGFTGGTSGSQTNIVSSGVPNGYQSSAVAYAGSGGNPSFYSNQPSYESNVHFGVQKDYSRPVIQGVQSVTKPAIVYNNSPLNTQGTKVHIDLHKNTLPMFTDTEIPLNYGIGLPSQSFETYQKAPQLGIETTSHYQTISPNVGPTPNVHKSSYVQVQNGPVPSSTYSNTFNPSHTDVHAEVYVDRPQGTNVQYNTNPSHISYQTYQGPTVNNVDHFRAQLSPSYKLFSVDNLLKLKDALLKQKQFNRLTVDEDRALSNLYKIDSILLSAAENIGNNGLSKVWYENIFLNGGDVHKHPMHFYIYNLIRQKWLHEILLLLNSNNFNLNILNNPKLISFLSNWQLPTDISKFLELNSIGTSQQNSPYHFEATFGAQNVLPNKDSGYQEIIDSDILDNYATANEGLILSITGFDVGLDAIGIIDILKKYLLYKNYVESQENVIKRGSKIEMFKQIMIFLKEKGYDKGTIVDLIKKLYEAVYKVEATGCSRSQFNDFAQNAYDVIVPVLRRSAQ